MSATKKEKNANANKNESKESNLQSKSSGQNSSGESLTLESETPTQKIQLKLDLDSVTEPLPTVEMNEQIVEQAETQDVNDAPNIFDVPEEKQETTENEEKLYVENFSLLDGVAYDENKNVFDVDGDNTSSEGIPSDAHPETVIVQDKPKETAPMVPTSTVKQAATPGTNTNPTSTNKPSNGEGNAKSKPKSEKMNKFEKRKMKLKKQEDLLNLRGIPKYMTTFVVETLYIFLVEVILKLLCGNFAFDWSLLRIFLSSMLFALVLDVITNNMPIKLRRGILVVMNFFVVFYAWLQYGFLEFLGSFMSVGNAEQGTKAIEYIIDFISSYSFVSYTIFIPFILTIVYLVFERNITKDGFAKKISFKSFYVDASLIIEIAIICFTYYVTLEVDFMQNVYQTIPNKTLFVHPSNAVVAIKNFGSTMYFFLDVDSTIIRGDKHNLIIVDGDPGEQLPSEVTDYTREIDDEAWSELVKIESNADYSTLNNYFINRKITEKNEYTGLFEGKNLVMIMLESVAEPIFHEEFKEYYPTLYKLYNEGITAVNNYSPMNNCGTGESERTSQTSLYSIETTCTVNTYKNNEYQQALLYMLRKNGYYTTTYHDFDNRYYDRNTFEYKFGAMRYYNANDLGMNLSEQYSEWPSDREFMELAVPNFIDHEKFASYMITVSAHTPYIFDSAVGSKHLDLFEGTNYDMTTKRYLSKVKEADLAIEHLLDSLEEAGKLDDTVIVIFGDHYPYALSDKNYQAIAPYDISVNNEVDRTPFIIYNSETEPQKITKYTSPMDYTPTLLNLFGIDYDPRYYMGNDIFSDYTDYVLFQDNSWQNASGFYSASKGAFTPSGVETNLSDEEIIAINREALIKRDMSGLAIKTNYFDYLFKYFEEYENLHKKDENEDEPEDDSKKEAEEKR